MAEKVLKTKIKLRYDTYAKWKTANPILEKGEIAVVEIDTKDPANKLLPPIMFKVGNGQSNSEGVKLKFNDLNWSSALAADVYDWAKAPQKPTYNYSEIQNLPTIPTDTDTQYRLVLSDHKLTLQSKEKGATSWTNVQDITLPDNDTTYTFEEGTENGKFKVIPSVGDPISVPIHGLKSAAYQEEGYFDKNGAADAVLGQSTDDATKNTVYGAKKAAAAAQATANTANATANAALPKSEFNTFKTANDTALGKKVDKTTKVNGHLLSTDVEVTKEDVGLKLVENKALDTTVTKDSGNYITSGAVKTYVDNKVAGAVDYLGTVAKMADVTALTPDSEGDFCRVSTGFTLTAASSGSNADVPLHAGDLLLCKALANGTTPVQWDVIHGEIDKNTWTKNSATADGYVTKTGGAANKGKVWKVDAEGNPGWLSDDNTNTSHSHTGKLGLICTGTGGTSGTVEYKAALKSETLNKNAALAVPTANANRFYPVEVDKDGKLAVTVPWTDTKITDTNQKIKAGGTTFEDNAVIDIAGGTNITVTPGTNKITINGKSDDAINDLITAKINGLAVSNITGMGAGKTIKTLTETDGKINATFQDISIVASQISNLATAHPGVDKSGTVTKVSATAGSGLKITGTATETPNVDWDDTVTLVFDCGDSRGPV